MDSRGGVVCCGMVPLSGAVCIVKRIDIYTWSGGCE